MRVAAATTFGTVTVLTERRRLVLAGARRPGSGGNPMGIRRRVIATAAALLLVASSVGVASAATTTKVAYRGYAEGFSAGVTTEPMTPVAMVTYTRVFVGAGASHALQAGSGYQVTGPVTNAETNVMYEQYYRDAAGVFHQTLFRSVGTRTAPRIDPGLSYAIAGNDVPGVGRVEIGCVGYGPLVQTSWPGSTGRARACTPTLYINGVAQSGMRPVQGQITAATTTGVVVIPLPR
jgi:hypothetical protein